MPYVELDTLLDQVRAEAPQAPTDLMVQQMRLVIREFCNFTRAWLHEDNDTVAAQVSDYDIELPNNHVEPIAIEYLEVDGAPAKFRDLDWLDRFMRGWRLREGDDFRYFTQLEPLIYTFASIPQTNGSAAGIYYRVSLRPKVDGTQVDEKQADEWLDVWSVGAKARLLAFANKPWSDRQRAADLQREYLAGRGQARIRAGKAYGNADQQWANPRGFA